LADTEAKDFAKGVYRAFNHHGIDAKHSHLAVEVTNATYSQEYPFEQVNLDINMKAPTCLDPDYAAVKVIENILSGSYGRIHQATRGDNDLLILLMSCCIRTKLGYFRVPAKLEEKANN
jgi:Zn-dependent M16 (insulinase) family peptidase